MRRYTRSVVTAAGIAALFLLGSGSIEQLSQRLFAQAPQGDRLPGPIIVDPPGPYQGHSYIPAPPRASFQPDGSSLLSTFQVTYTGFTPQAQAAFQAAVDVWANIVQSPVPIRVNANWTVLGSNVLGSAGSHFIWRNFSGAPVAGTFYPDALADRLGGVDLSPGTPDIDANFNSNFTWYYGTDGNITTPNTYDLMSVVLHELGHGLGFFGSLTTSDGVNGKWGQGGPITPYIYDRFAVNNLAQSILDPMFPNPGTALFGLLTGGNLFFNGTAAKAANSNANAKLYAPATFNGGSSYSHLDEVFNNTANALMTFSLGASEVVHDPGPVTKGMFADMGWNSAALSTTPGSLQFGATKNGTSGALVSTTPTQQVAVTFSGTSSAWTATTTTPWLQITNGSGSSAGQFTVALINPGNTIGGSTTLNGSITISAPGLGASTAVAVKLTVQQNPATSLPAYGNFDTPANNAANLSGAIGVTGWALDDIGVSFVQIWRNCVPAIDPPNACRDPGNGAGPNFVFIGDAAFLAGARADVELLNPGAPFAYRAGWGYMMSTNALPHLPTGFGAGGQGTFTLSAFAVDVESHFTLLGTKTITLNNDGATIPFGVLDSPLQGGTVTSSISASFGWAMTQMPKCILPNSPTAYKVYIDGVSRTLTPNVNWFPGLTRPDIAAAYPGRCNTNDALAAYYIDVNALGLANGLHTTGWDVFDNATPTPQIAGIGSRFFNLLVGSAVTPDLKVGPTSVGSGFSRIADADSAEIRLKPDPANEADRPVALGHSSGLAWLAPDRNPVKIQIGGDEAPFQTSDPSSSGEHRVQFPSGGRLGIDLGGPVTAGFQVVGNELRALPGGSTLLADEGFFAWQPAVPFLGPFHLVFVRDHLRIDVKARIVDAAADLPVEMHIDLPSADSNIGGSFIVAGWALDPLAASGSGIDTLHVWAIRRDAVATPRFLGAAAVGGLRPDLAAIKGDQFERTGFSLTTPSLAPGVYDILVYPWSHRAAAFQGAQSVRITVR